MENIQKAFRLTREALGLAATEKNRLEREGFKGVPAILLDAVIDLTKAQVKLERALEMRVQDIGVEIQTMSRREEHGAA